MLIFGTTQNTAPNTTEITQVFPIPFNSTPYVSGTYVGNNVEVNVIVLRDKTDKTKVTFNKTDGINQMIGGPVHYFASGRWK